MGAEDILDEALNRPDRKCPTCSRPLLDHLVREWFDCVGKTQHETPWREAPDMPTLALDDRDVKIADHLFVYVAEVCLIASNGDNMRKFGKLLRQGASRAANAAEGRKAF